MPLYLLFNFHFSFLDKDSLQDAVKSGIPLLELVCFLKQGIVDESKWNKREIALHYVANLKLFISAVVTLGLKPSEVC